VCSYFIECKRLQFAKTIPEIAEVCNKFKGDAKDELRKHLNRVEFLESNLKNFKRVIGFIPEKSKTFDRLVTNTIVPMQFIKDLPIESSKIGPINEPFVL